jgi:NADH-quinone oxidoreductase subunit G
VVLPAANLYEKSGCVSNSYGDLQQVKKAADRAGVRTDFEMIVRIADKMGANVRKLVPFLPAIAQEPAPTWGRRAARSLARPIATPYG